MKKIHSIILLLTVLVSAVSFSSCSDDDNYTPAQHLKLKQADAIFSASAQKGHIHLEKAQGLAAKSEAAWCQVVVENDSTIQISVERNNSLVGRSTILDLSDRNGRTAQLSVTQQGAVWYVMGDSVYLVSDNESEVTIPIHSDYEYTVDQPEWVKGTKSEDGYVVSLQPNETGSTRCTNLIFKSEKGERSIKIYQFGSNDIAGTYELTYGVPVSATENRDTTVTVDIVRDETNEDLFYMKGASVMENINIPFVYDPLTFSLKISGGQPLGKVGASNFYVFTALASSYGAHVSSSITYPAKVAINPATLLPTFKFFDEEGFEYYDAMGDAQFGHIYGILTFGTREDRASLDANNFVGYADKIMDPVLRKTK